MTNVILYSHAIISTHIIVCNKQDLKYAYIITLKKNKYIFDIQNNKYLGILYFSQIYCYFAIIIKIRIIYSYLLFIAKSIKYYGYIYAKFIFIFN